MQNYRLQLSSSPTEEVRSGMLFLRKDQAVQLLQLCRERIATAPTQGRKSQRLKQLLMIRYFMLNGLSPMELSNARIEHLDPMEGTLFLPRRHWKKDCLTDIDEETVKLQIIYSGSRKKGPLVRSRNTRGHIQPKSFCRLVKLVAVHTTIPNAERITPLILKRTFARLYIKTPGNTIAGLQKQFSHRHLWSTAHYLKFVLDDVKIEHNRMVRRIEERTVENR